MDASAQRDQHLHGLDELLASYAAQGDDGLTPRSVRHMAVFTRRSDAEAAAASLRGAGFEVRQVRRGLVRSTVEFERSDPVTRPAVTAFVDEIVTIVTRHGGEYDGWGSFAHSGDL